MADISQYSGANKVLKILYNAKGAYDSLPERLDALEAGSGGGAGVSNQVTKLGVVGSIGTPYVENITITESVDFLLGAVEVLKFIAGNSNVVTTICSFNNGDQSSFNTSDYVIFDGVMKLKTSDTFAMTDNGALGSGKVFSKTFDKSLYNIKSMVIA